MNAPDLWRRAASRSVAAGREDQRVLNNLILTADSETSSEARVARPVVGELFLAYRSGDDWWRVETRGSAVAYQRGRSERMLEEQERTPAGGEWQRFWSTVERLGVWRWADSFSREGGDEHWQLRLQRHDRRLVTGGSSAFPPLAFSRPSPDFLTLCGAVSQLVGVLMPFP